MQFTASAPSKVILFGEHACVYGYNAIAAAIDLRTRATVSKINSEFPLILYQNETLDRQKKYLGAKEVLLKLARFIDETSSYSVSVSSDVPESSGLGSSASFCVAVAAGMLATHGIWDLEKINEMAFLGEVEFHGSPSGLDNSVITYGGFYSNNFGKINLTLPSCWLLNSKLKKDTRTQVEKVKKQYLSNREVIDYIFKAIDACAVKSLDCSFENFKELIKLNQSLLCALGVSNPTIDALVMEKCAKITGSGGGGYLISFDEVEGTKVSLGARGVFIE